tara:strand:- start:1520 stop:2119 length:600 start_codon:yes stop_codon:yes gene_type:complete
MALLPSQSEFFQESCIQLVSTILTRMAEANDHCPGETSRFHSVYKPDLSIDVYIDRIVRYTSISVEVFACAFLYILRFSQRTGMIISSLNLHRLIITSVTISMKYHEDRVYSNQYMAKVGGVSLAELNNLEAAFLERMDYSLGVSSKIFEAFCFETCQLDAALAMDCTKEESTASVHCSTSEKKSLDCSFSQPSLTRTV